MSFLPQPSSCCNQTCSSGTDSTTSTESLIQVIVGSYQDPNGNVTPDNLNLGAEYYEDNVLANLWRWSVADQIWYNTITYT